ncbi:NAD(P)-dependent oxidoreductase [Janibacter terrae]|uniref:NAD(P)-dependent oxidoreductase n=1 Tax=Janibacter terrae TaxID=103817 RepID=UPI000837FC34|nr:SDR family oxidoreductase [Janibacter terrae]
MRITVFGATGSVGRLVVDRALDAGHDVTAFTRDRARVHRTHDRLTVVEGDVTDPGPCLPAVRGADAVVITLGNGAKGVVREAGTGAVVRAMAEAGVRRLVCQSSIGVGTSRANLNFFWRRIMFGGLLRRAYADHVRQEEVVTASDLDWTIVRPSAFSDDPVPGVRHGFGPDATGLQLKVGRDDIAAFLLAEAEHGRSLRQQVSLSA